MILYLEIMKKIKGFDGYYCDFNGNIFSDKSGSLKKMKLKTTTRGYCSVMLYCGSRGSGRDILVHRIVAELFVDNINKNKEVNHIDGVKTNNYAGNLEWVSRKENENHARKFLGKDLKGSKHKLSKLTEDQVIELRKLREYGWTYIRLSKKFGIGISQAHRICKRLKWGHV